MNESKGKFICPKCNNNIGIASANGKYSDGNYKNWIYKKVNNNGTLEKKWFFYNREEYWYCCSCCEGNHCDCNEFLTCFSCDCGDCKNCDCDCGEIFSTILGLFISLIFFPIAYLIYFLIFLWIDICNYCCKNHVYYYSFGKKDSSKVKANEIWESAKFESELESVTPWICLGCKHNSPSFKDFIFQLNVLNNTAELQDLKADDFYLNGIISVLFRSVDDQINYAVTCKKSEIFSNVEKKLIDKFPEYKNKKLFYIQSGKVIDKEKSLEENGVTSGFAVLVKTEEE